MKLSFKSNHTLNEKIKALPKGPKWSEWSTTLSGSLTDTSGNKLTETVTMLRRDPVEVIAELVNNPMLAKGMTFAPEHAYVDADKTVPLYDEMWTGDAWHRAQVRF
jgi:hypothetical protein